MVERFDNYSYVDFTSDKKDDDEGTPLISVSGTSFSVEGNT